MAENQENQLPPAIPADLANQNPAPRTMYDYAKPNLIGTESSIMDIETLYDAWERYNDLLRRCPHHGLPLWLQVQTFYNGVNPSTRQMIDAAVGGTINNKTPKEAYEFIEEMSLNNYQWQVMRTKPTKTAGVYNIDSVTILSNQVELLNKKIDGLVGSTQVHPIMRCDSSGGSAHTEYQPFNPTTEEEQVNYMGNITFRSQNNPYSNAYNAGWRNHPNFSLGGQGNKRSQNPLGFQQPPCQQEKKSNLEEIYPNSSQCSLPSNTEPNLREQLNAINTQGEEGSVEPEPEPREGIVVSKGEERLVNKRKLDEASHVELNAVSSAVLQNKLPNKLKDPGSFTIPFLVGSLDVNNALADLRASIKVMPYKMFKQLGLGKPKQTRMSIQLADKTIRFPRRIIEDVLVKIDKFIFLVDFVVLDIEEDSNTPLILGRPFLATAKRLLMLAQVNSRFVWEMKQSPFKLTILATHQKLKEMSLKDVHEQCSSNNRGPIHEERRLQIEELDEWRTHKSRTYDKLKLRQNKFNTSPNQPKVGDKVLLDAVDPHIVTTKPNEEIPLTVLSISHSAVEVSHPSRGTFMVNGHRLKLYNGENFKDYGEELRLHEPP
ncbi:hypothetical protein CXB51_008149 [Gossypium anomalum]|uniref:Retrotransposon gag domain-containing protein n=1 Tax=Gossypium anomalum TaxID=47600 RepID=A0A8J5Z8S1_9ROSI|nr:hypothetical protein CXB51_008149 [Gossypium anomalum]